MLFNALVYRGVLWVPLFGFLASSVGRQEAGDWRPTVIVQATKPGEGNTRRDREEKYSFKVPDVAYVDQTADDKSMELLEETVHCVIRK